MPTASTTVQRRLSDASSSDSEPADEVHGGRALLPAVPRRPSGALDGAVSAPYAAPSASHPAEPWCPTLPHAAPDADSDSAASGSQLEIGAPFVGLELPVHRRRGRPRKYPRPDEQAAGFCAACQRPGTRETLVRCAQCGACGHPSCLEISTDLASLIRTYAWQCMNCKTCTVCREAGMEDRLMLCDRCDRGYHTFCVGMQSLPKGKWCCPSCLQLRRAARAHIA